MPARTKEISIMPSTIETIDRAFYRWLDEELNAFSTTNKGWKKVPVIWVSAERAYQIKNNKDLRDSNGVLRLPLITLERTSIVKDPASKGVAWAHLPPKNDAKGGAIEIARTINQEKTSNFQNADSARKQGIIGKPTAGSGQQNSRTKSDKIVYNTISMQMPTYINVSYTVSVRTEYQQQINEILTPFITKTGQIDNFFIFDDGHKFEGFIQGNFGQGSNVASLGDDERTYNTKIEIRILGYLIGEGPNAERPKIVMRENAVEFRFPRERAMTQDELRTYGSPRPRSVLIKKGLYRE
jgi:hypothetical protein